MSGSDQSNGDAEKRRDEILKRLLSTPPEPREKAAERGKRKRQSASESEKGKERSGQKQQNAKRAKPRP